VGDNLDELRSGESPLTFDVVVRDYATLSPETSRQRFPGQKQLHRRWGALYVEGQRSGHWTLLGDHAFCGQLQQAGRPPEVSNPDVERVPWGRRNIPEHPLEEFPFEAFHPAWLIRGWPEEWEPPHEANAYACPPVDVRFPSS
jgi:hypothetical protein